MKKIILLGASGMVGELVLQNCLNDEAIKEVVSLVRKKSSVQHAKLTEVVLFNFNDYTLCNSYFSDVDAAFFCIGVYTGTVAKDLFNKITVDYPVRFAEALHKKSPNATFCLLSGQRADRSEKSKILFAKAKGQAENKLAAIGFKKFHAFRPGYIYPVTKRIEPNLTYRVMRFIYPLIKFGKNLCVTSKGVAKAMFEIGTADSELFQQEIFENADLKKYDDKV